MTFKYFGKWAKCAGIRAIKTFAQVMIAMIGTEYVAVSEVEWAHCLSVAAVAAVVSVLMSLAGLPELKVPDIEEAEEPEKIDGSEDVDEDGSL